jgi:signal transduction histidine kinase
MIPNLERPVRCRSSRLAGTQAAFRDDRKISSPGRGRGRANRLDGSKSWVLLVEDDRAIREPLSVLLRGEGYEVSLAENGQEALRKLRTERTPDIIVLDLRMPVMDGWEFRAKQKQDPVFGLVPVVAISADGSAQAVTMSADAYLRKPLDPTELLQTIERILSEREWRQMSARLEEAERLASLGRVAAAVGHEINNPLAFVVLNIDQSLADLRALDGVPPAIVDTLESCQSGLERIRRTVGNLKRLARPEDEKRGPVDVGKLIDQSVAMAWNQIRHRARFVSNLVGLPPIHGNAPALGQVFLNLLVNAAQAIPEGNAEQNEISVTTRAAGGEIVVEVRDTGVGIAPETLTHVFEPFFTTKPVGVGTGLGLFISHQTVTDHGGRLEIESQLDQGSLFRVILPCGPYAAATAPATAPVIVTAPAGRRGRVLIIDDEPAIGGAIRAGLRDEHDVVVVQRAADAFARFDAGETFDLVLCDLVMPDVSGPQVYATIAERWPALTACLVFMTGGAFTSETEEFMEKAAAPIFTKPFRLDQLKQLVRERITARQ